MTLHKAVDASAPGGTLPAGTEILLGYVGEVAEPGAPDTPHIWTPAEWNSYVAFAPELRLCPIYVNDHRSDPIADAGNAADAVFELGWTPEEGRYVVFDVETLVDPAYVGGFLAELERRGYLGIPYGSFAFVTQNPAPHGRFLAQLTKRPPTSLPADVVGIQWRFGTTWDDSVFNDLFYHNCGVGPRKG